MKSRIFSIPTNNLSRQDLIKIHNDYVEEQKRKYKKINKENKESMRKFLRGIK